MLYIAYRGLFNGEDPQTEDTPDQIGKAFNHGYAVMADVWRVDNKMYLGANEPITEVTERYLQGNKFWLAARNNAAYAWLQTQPSKSYPHYFLQPAPTTPTVLTSDNKTWAFAEFQAGPYDASTVVCLPEIPDRGMLSTVHYKCYGICTIFPEFVRRIRQEGGNPYNFPF